MPDLVTCPSTNISADFQTYETTMSADENMVQETDQLCEDKNSGTSKLTIVNNWTILISIVCVLSNLL